MEMQQDAGLDALLIGPDLVDEQVAQLSSADNKEAQLHSIDNCTGASFSKTCINLCNTLSGLGVLSMPYAVAQGGWLSLAVFFLVAAVCCYTGTLIERFLRTHPSKIKSYDDIGHLAFGLVGRMSVGFLIYLDLFLVATSFLVLEGDSLEKLFPNASIHILGHLIPANKLFTIVAAVVVLPTTWLSNLSILAYVSAIGLVASAALTTSLVWAGADAHGFHVGGGLLKVAGLPTSLALYFVCFAGHPVFPTLYSSMKKKKDFTKVLLISSVVCGVNYTLTATLGYMIYGDGVQSIVTLNLPSRKIYTKLAIVTTLITPLAKYAIIIQPIIRGIEDKLSSIAKNHGGLFKAYTGLTRATISTTIVVSTVVLACALPFFEYIMSFIGSFLNITVIVLFPCLSYLKLFMPGGGIHRAEVVFLIILLVAGSFLGILGTYTTVDQIVHALISGGARNFT